jgi:hypothetical protein
MFKGRHFDQSVTLLCVRWYLAYGLSLRRNDGRAWHQHRPCRRDWRCATKVWKWRCLLVPLDETNGNEKEPLTGALFCFQASEVRPMSIASGTVVERYQDNFGVSSEIGRQAFRSSATLIPSVAPRWASGPPRLI